MTPELTKLASRSQLMRGRRRGERELHVCPNTRNTGVGGSWLPGQPEEKRRASKKRDGERRRDGEGRMGKVQGRRGKKGWRREREGRRGQSRAGQGRARKGS